MHHLPQVGPGSTHPEFLAFLLTDENYMFTGEEVSAILPQRLGGQCGSGHVLYGVVVSICRLTGVGAVDTLEEDGHGGISATDGRCRLSRTAKGR